jgi:hypothetical protein
MEWAGRRASVDSVDEPARDVERAPARKLARLSRTPLGEELASRRGLARIFRLFVASYSPLALILAVQRSEGIWPPGDRPAFWFFAAVSLIGLIDAYRLPRGALRKAHIRVTLSEVTDEGGQVAAYIATYLLPFLGFALVGWRDGVALAIYFAVLFVAPAPVPP